MPGLRTLQYSREMLRESLRYAGVPAAVFVACVLVAASLHEPAPRIHDEFSYMLLSDTFAHGRMSNPAPSLPEFFESFHVLTRPVYASKYFPAQGLFLALGQKLTGHPVVGVWLSSALTCAAIIWMLGAWTSTQWALLGGFLAAVQYGIYSYWSQAYWGGMIAALGGALTFGAARRLWDEFSWPCSLWFALGILFLINSRPFEGLFALLPLTAAFIVKFRREKVWNRAGFYSRFAVPLAILLGLGAAFTLSYYHAITGSFSKTPYMLHEQRYQETPQFTFLPLRPKLTYSNPWLQYYSEVQEMRLYQKQRHLGTLISGFSGRVASWWGFFCGILLSIPLVLPGLLRTGRVRYFQAAILFGMVAIWFSGPKSPVVWGAFDLLVFVEIGLLWIIFDQFWPRVAIVTSTLLILEALITKWYFPHYFAPASCLVLYLEVEGLRRLWNWEQDLAPPITVLTRSERRRNSRQPKIVPWLPSKLRVLVRAIPVICLVSLVLRMEGNLQGWKKGLYDTDRNILPLDDWSLRRADLEKWMNRQLTPQLVFVRYSPRHNVNYEWVYNHADLMHSQVVWARDLGVEHDQMLLKVLPNRTIWLLEADRREPQLVPYTELEDAVSAIPVGQTQKTVLEEDDLDW